jgi:hypothetical protein
VRWRVLTKSELLPLTVILHQVYFTSAIRAEKRELLSKKYSPER